jgi:hypothetical protein
VTIWVSDLHGTTDQTDEEAAMVPATNRYGIRELAHRRSAGVEVWLYWDPVADDVLVHVNDQRDNRAFALLPAKGDAMYAFRHPFAVLGSGGPGGPADVVGPAPLADAA